MNVATLLFRLYRVVIPLTENKKCAKYTKHDSLRPIVLDHTFLYTDNGSISEYARLWNKQKQKCDAVRAYFIHISSYFVSRITTQIWTSSTDEKLKVNKPRVTPRKMPS